MNRLAIVVLVVVHVASPSDAAGGLAQAADAARRQRTVALAVLKLDGWVQVRRADQEDAILEAGDLPGESFDVVGIHLSDSRPLSDKALEFLVEATEVRELDLSGHRDLGPDALRAVARMTKLEELDVGGCAVTDAGIAHLAGLKSLRSLSMRSTSSTDTCLATVSRLKSLEELSIGGNHITSEGLPQLAALKQLTSLDLSATSVKDSALGALFAELRDLESVSLEMTYVQGDCLAAFTGRKKLKSLNLKGTRVADAALAHLEGCALEKLELWGTSACATEQGGQSLAGAVTGALDLRGATITDAGLQGLIGFRGKELHLGGGRGVTEAGLVKFLESQPKLTQLTLYGATVTDAVVEPLKKIETLRLLYLRETKVTRQRSWELERALPECRMVVDDRVR